MNLFPNVLHVARREYLTRVRGRAFVITTILLAVAVLAVTLLPTILSALGVADPPRVAVHTEVDDLSTDPVLALQAAMIIGADPLASPSADDEEEDGASDAANRPRVTRATDREEAEQSVRDGDLDALLTITRDESGNLAFEFLGSSSPTNRTRVLVTAAAMSLAIGDRLEREGIGQEQRERIFETPSFTAVPVDPNDATERNEFGGAVIVAYAAVILTFMAILTYGNWVAQSVAEEKSGRVMELLITAATPRQLLIGKVLGSGAAGLSQYLVIIAAAAIGFFASGPLAQQLGVSGQAPISLPSVPPTVVLAFTAFFLLGFLLYCTLYAAAGSMVSRIEDVQQAAGPLIFLAMAGYLASFTALNDPDAQWVAVLSIIPFFSPYLMPARMLLTSPPAGEVLLALGLLAVTVALALLVASRIYSAGVLLYGQRLGLRTVWRATRVAR